jgi:hypothetical protein
MSCFFSCVKKSWPEGMRCDMLPAACYSFLFSVGIDCCTSRAPCATAPLRYRVALDLVVYRWLVCRALSACVRLACTMIVRRTGSAFEVLCQVVSMGLLWCIRASFQNSCTGPHRSSSLSMGLDVLFFKKSRTSFALKSRTGT